MLTQHAAANKDSISAKYPAKFEHRHFAAIAGWIKMADSFSSPITDELLRKEFAEWFAACLAVTNDRFDRRRFLKACGVQS